jgi:hypothetical protein
MFERCICTFKYPTSHVALFSEVDHILQGSVVGHFVLREHISGVDSAHLGIVHILNDQNKERGLIKVLDNPHDAEAEDELVELQRRIVSFRDVNVFEKAEMVGGDAKLLVWLSLIQLVQDFFHILRDLRDLILALFALLVLLRISLEALHHVLGEDEAAHGEGELLQ